MKKIYTIGRDSGCDIVIPDNTDVISRLHATLRIEANDKIFLIDQSLNGTYVNGMKMSSNVEIPISRNDVVSFAHIYNLDWSMVPKRKNRILKILLIVLACLAVLAGVLWFVLRPSNQEPEPYYPEPVEEVIAAPENTAEEKAEEVVLPIKPKQPKKVVEKEPEPVVAKPKEEPKKEVVDPLY